MIMIVKDFNDRPEGLRYLGCFKSNCYYAIYRTDPLNPEAKEMAERFNRGEYAILKDGKIYYGSQNLFT